MLELINTFLGDIEAVEDEEGLEAVLSKMSSDLGFRYFALTHHVDLRHGRHPPLRIHNYPEGWEAYFDEQTLGGSDPVHRASQTTGVGFAWSALPRMINLTNRDRRILIEARRYGIGDGYTIPCHIPGKANGSCSFAVRAGDTLPERLGPAQLVGSQAFGAARRVARQPARCRPFRTMFPDASANA
jgi:LuxR family quorum-sensing system transcriptional regulator CciR